MPFVSSVWEISKHLDGIGSRIDAQNASGGVGRGVDASVYAQYSTCVGDMLVGGWVQCAIVHLRIE
jgi:hypothetical protein